MKKNAPSKLESQARAVRHGKLQLCFLSVAPDLGLNQSETCSYQRENRKCGQHCSSNIENMSSLKLSPNIVFL